MWICNTADGAIYPHIWNNYMVIKMSLNSVKAKETKGKQKCQPKLKTILANPKKTKCPVLSEQEMDAFKSILQDAMKGSELQPRKYATAKSICLGLESSLRNINNKKSSCVFISLSIKPSHVVSLIARNAEIKNEIQPIFAQPKLENFIEELFGIQALCMVLPIDLLNISKALNDWVEERKKSKKVAGVTTDVNKKYNLKRKLEKPKIVKQGGDAEDEAKKEPKKKEVVNPCSGNYISFGKISNKEIGKSKINDDQAVDALTNILDKIPTASLPEPKITQGVIRMEVNSEGDVQTEHVIKTFDEEASDDSDGFLNSSEYMPLIVHKIKGNPNKKPKKKKNKKKKTIK